MYVHVTDYDFNHIYDMKVLKDYFDYAARDIQRAEEVIQKIKDYQMRLFEHAQKVAATPMKKFVILRRQKDYYTNHVTYFVTLDIRPDIETNRNDIKGEQKHTETFKGRDRLAAIRYAEDLAKKYNCPLERKGFKC